MTTIARVYKELHSGPSTIKRLAVDTNRSYGAVSVAVKKLYERGDCLRFRGRAGTLYMLKGRYGQS